MNETIILTAEASEVILSEFIAAVSRNKDICRSHVDRTFTYDDSATLRYEGDIVRCGGVEGHIFHIVKQKSFFILILIPDPSEYKPTIQITGDIAQAEKFLLAFQMAGGAWK